ncbi:MAG: hypothetical protein AMJ81_13085 [Phycisphaerae bacterium SM23_33]|nr:MAG: hypothetical protein AMJ81_13085 [Phycisphaerae bacterium SM23_33]
MLTDAQLVGRVLSGDTQAFGSLVARYEGLVAAVCRGLIDDDHEALDAAQDAFVRAHLNLGQLRDPGRLAGWLRRVAYSVCMNRLKGRGGGAVAITPEQLDAMQLPDAAPGPAQQAEARELAQAVLASIARLPEKYREPIRMFYRDGASGAEIADRLGLRAGAVRTRLSRGRDLLRPALAKYGPVEMMSRNKQLRGWLPARLSLRETPRMKLEYQKTTRRLLRGEAEVTIRPMKRHDIAALRRFDDELTPTLDEVNAQFPPGGHAAFPGGPWADDKELLEHFLKYQRHGGMALLALEDSGRVVGFADLWAADEPEPFGRSLDVECIDYFRDYFLAGLETVLLAEAEKVARAAGLAALDIGTNTCSGEYVSLRRFGLKVFYEYDDVLCRCPAKPAGTGAERRVLTPGTAELTGLVKANHWCPTDFTFRGEDEPSYLAELSRPDRRAIVELWHFRPDALDNLPVPENPPNRSELFVQPETLTSPEMMGDILAECAALAGELGAEKIELPCPSELELDAGELDVLDRQFAFAWLRKRL